MLEEKIDAIEEISEKGKIYKETLKQLEEAKELQGGTDKEMAELAEAEVSELSAKVDVL